MNGLMLDLASDATIKAAVDDFLFVVGLSRSWLTTSGFRHKVAVALEDSKGIPAERTLAYLSRTGAPKGFSPNQRRWYFANTPEARDDEPVKEKKPENRWADIMEAARNALRLNPEMTGDELVLSINGLVEPDLSQSEENRVANLISSSRQHKLVAPPEEVPLEERTPEIAELIEAEWERIQQLREKEKEEKKTPKPVEKKKSPPPASSKGVIPPFSGQGIPYVGASRIRDERTYFKEEYSDVCDADHWRAYQRAITLLRSGVEDKIIKGSIGDVFPEVDVNKVLDAASGFVKQASGSYVRGQRSGRAMVVANHTSEELAAIYSNMKWQGVDPTYLRGFYSELSTKTQRKIGVY